MTKVQTSAEEIYHPALPLDLIEPSPTNPRKHLTEASIAEMADSITAHGVAQPIRVRPHPRRPGCFEIIFGERRYRGSLKAGKKTIPAIESKVDDLTVAELQLVENLQREDVHELDEANGYRELQDKHGMTAGAIAERISKSEKYVYDRLKLLDLVPGLQDLFYARKMAAGHAILLARRPAVQQEAYAKGDAAAAFAGLSVRQLGRMLEEKKPPEPRTSRTDGSFTFRDHATAMLRAASDGDLEARAAIAEILSKHLSEIGSKGAKARWHPPKKVQTSALRRRS